MSRHLEDATAGRESPDAETAAADLPPSRVERILASRWCLPLALFAGALMRIVHVLALRSVPWFETLSLDHRSYDEWAVGIAAGNWIGDTIFFVDPLYPYFLAVLYTVFGHDLVLVRLVQAGLGLGSCLLTALIGRRLFGKAVGNLAGLLAALFVPSIYYEAMIDKTALSVLLVTLSLFLLLGRSQWSRPAAGVVLGLAVLTRGNLIIFVPLGFLAAILLERGSRQDQRLLPYLKSLLDRRVLVRASLFALGSVLILGAVAVRNHHVGGEWVVTTSNLGQNLFIGNNPGNDVGSYRPPGFIRPDPRYEQGDFKKEAEKRVGRPLSTREVSAYWTSKVVQHVKDQPGFAFKMLFRKLRWFWADYELPDNNNLYFESDFSPVLKLRVVSMGLIVPLALIGGVVAFRRRLEVRVLVGFALTYCATVVAFFVFSRFRIQISQTLFVLAAFALIWAWNEGRKRNWKKLLPAGVVAALVAAFCFTIPGSFDPDSAMAIAYNNLGTAYLRLERPDDAIKAYSKAVEYHPPSVVGALRQLGNLHMQRRQFALAERYMTQVVEIKPQSRLGWAALAKLYENWKGDGANDPQRRVKFAEVLLQLGRTADAKRVAQKAEERGAQLPQAFVKKLENASRRSNRERANAHYQRARQFRKEERWAEAIKELKRGIAVGSYNENARYLLGFLMTEHADPDETIAYHSKASLTDPKPQTSHLFWALALAKKGDYDGAIGQFEKAVEIDPAHELSHLQWGVVLEQQGRLDEALAHYRRAVYIHPDFPDGHERLAKLLKRLSRDEEAAEHFRLAKQANPNTPKRFYYWARVLVEEGRYEAAIDELKRALEAMPDDPEATALLEVARQGAGR